MILYHRFQLVTGRTWRGSAFGGVKGRTEIPGLVEGMYHNSYHQIAARSDIGSDYLQGKVKIDEYVTHHRTLDEISAGFHDMHVSSSM